MAQPITVEPVTHGRVRIITTAGPIDLELWPREAPKACRNFVQLALEGYYEGCIWHRVVPNLCVQTGDASNSGEGGDSIYDGDVFEDEFSQRLRFNRRGMVAMANMGKRNTNLSQFFITLDRADGLQNKHTIFGTVRGDTYFNVLKISESELEPGTERPVYPIYIKSIEVDDNPFPDIVPRITAAEKRLQEKARKESRKAAATRGKKKEGVKNKSLVSFGDEADLAEDSAETKSASTKKKFASAHDLLDDPSLSKESKDDRGLPAIMPEGFGEVAVVKQAGAKRKAAEMTKETPPAFDSSAFSSRMDREEPRASTSSAAEPSKKSKAAGQTEGDRVKAEIAKVQADLKKLTKRGGSDDEGEESDNKKKQKSAAKISGAELLAAERAKYTKGGRSVGKSSGEKENIPNSGATRKGKGKKEDDEDVMDMLEGFRSRVRAAVVTTPQGSNTPEPVEEAAPAPAPIDGYNGEILEGDDDDEGWMAHTLTFRKDATMDRHTIDEYEVVDPREKGMTLEDAQREEARRMRKFEDSRGGRDGPSRNGSGGGYERSGRGDRGSDRRGNGSGGYSGRSNGGGRDYGRGDRTSDRRDSGRRY